MKKIPSFPVLELPSPEVGSDLAPPGTYILQELLGQDRVLGWLVFVNLKQAKILWEETVAPTCNPSSQEAQGEITMI